MVLLADYFKKMPICQGKIRMDIDDRDRMILRLLQQDGRISNADLAEKVNLSASACLRRVRLLEEAGFIDRYAMLLNPKRIGKPGNAFVNISIARQTRQALEDFEREIQSVPEVVECYLLAGQSDYLVHVVYSNTSDYERIHSEVLTQLPGVERVQTVITLREVKRTTELPV
jgi:DNA-binding Lrp family transcriptional regulator